MTRFFHLTMIAIFAVTLQGCSKSEINKDLKIDDASLDIDYLNAMPSKGGRSELRFEASTDWNISVSDTRTESWLSVTPSSGEAGVVTVVIEVSENETLQDRHAKIAISSGSNVQNINVTQKQKDALTVTSSRFEVSENGRNITIEVKANIDFQVAIAENSAGWISQVQTKALTTQELTFKVAPTTDLNRREGLITISNGEFSEEIAVFQSSGKILMLNTTERYITSQGGNIVAELNSNVSVRRTTYLNRYL